LSCFFFPFVSIRASPFGVAIFLGRGRQSACNQRERQQRARISNLWDQTLPFMLSSSWRLLLLRAEIAHEGVKETGTYGTNDVRARGPKGNE
jgi:hypothetical protein